MSQSINFRALQWAYEQENLSVTAKAVLMTFAIHANERGYTWPGVDHIAFTWGMDRETVRRQIEALLVRRMIYHTKKRRGATGQVKVYRLPKITYESGGKSHPFENDESEGKARDKRWQIRPE
jgi:Holliday junction resolvasome RuvABC ATP-dependent DNA helicase subunit